MLEIIIIGSGNRVIKDYLPILIYLEKTNPREGPGAQEIKQDADQNGQKMTKMAEK